MCECLTLIFAIFVIIIQNGFLGFLNFWLLIQLFFFLRDIYADEILVISFLVKHNK